jgi:hypothetical protein
MRRAQLVRFREPCIMWTFGLLIRTSALAQARLAARSHEVRFRAMAKAVSMTDLGAKPTRRDLAEIGRKRTVCLRAEGGKADADLWHAVRQPLSQSRHKA